MINKLLNRTSVRDYNPNKKIPDDIKEKFIKVINSSPTSMNASTFSAIIVENKETRKKLFHEIGSYLSQQHIIDASMLVIFCADLNRLNYIGQKNNVDINNGTVDLFAASIGDVFISATLLMTAAIDNGYGTCFLGSIRIAHEYLKKELNLEGEIVPIVGLAIGYPTKINDVKPKQNHVFIDKYDLNYVKNEINSYDKIMEEYFKNRSSNSKNINWSTQIANYFVKKDFNFADKNYESLSTFKKFKNNNC